MDDFDGSKNTTNLGVMRGHWTMASPPDLDNTKTGRHSIASRWKYFYWYNPYEQVDVKDIWPEKEAYAREGRTHVLTFDFTEAKHPLCKSSSTVVVEVKAPQPPQEEAGEAATPIIASVLVVIIIGTAGAVLMHRYI